MDSWQKMIELEKVFPTIKFHPITTELDAWGEALTKVYELLGPFFIGDINVQGAYILRTSDNYVKYIDIDPEFKRFNFIIDDNHRENEHPDKVSIYLINKKYPHMNLKLFEMEDGTTVINVDDKHTIIDSRRSK